MKYVILYLINNEGDFIMTILLDDTYILFEFPKNQNAIVSRLTVIKLKKHSFVATINPIDKHTLHNLPVQNLQYIEVKKKPLKIMYRNKSEGKYILVSEKEIIINTLLENHRNFLENLPTDELRKLNICSDYLN